MGTTVVWLRRDLRILDNPAMALALSEADATVCPIVVLDPGQLLSPRHSHPQRQAFIASVIACQRSFARRRIPLHVLWGDPTSVVPAVIAALQASRLVLARDVTPYAKARDKAVWEVLIHRGIRIDVVQERTISSLRESGPPTARGKAVYSVFTPFYRHWLTLARRSPAPSLTRQDPSRFLQNPESLTPWQAHFKELPSVLYPSEQEISKRSEAAALKAAGQFLRCRVQEYSQGRDRFAGESSSHLSYALRAGTLSALWLERACAILADRGIDTEAFRRQLAWRDFYYHLLDARPEAAHKAMRPAMNGFPYRADEAVVTAFKEARTGIPLVDAAVRQLKAEGFIPNRVRMVAASLATKQLGIDWRIGERFFAHWLIDYDQPQNVGGWQWCASAGTDAQPYFRLFDPARQGKVHDPEGRYIRRYLPELQSVPDRYVHCPWEMPKHVQETVGVKLGIDYPFPIVDLKQARHDVLTQFEAWHNRTGHTSL